MFSIKASSRAIVKRSSTTYKKNPQATTCLEDSLSKETTTTTTKDLVIPKSQANDKSAEDSQREKTSTRDGFSSYIEKDKSTDASQQAVTRSAKVSRKDLASDAASPAMMLPLSLGNLSSSHTVSNSVTTKMLVSEGSPDI